MKLKKYAFTLLAISALVGEVAAQSAPKIFPQTFDKTQSEPLPLNGQKTSGTGSRPLATSAYKSNGTTILPVDSQAFSYPSVTTLLNDVTFQYTYTGGAWAASYKNVFSYNAAGNVTGYDVLRWNSSTNGWDAYQKATYTLNTDGYPTTIMVQGWNSSTSSYQNSYQYKYVRDAANYPTQYTTQQWDFTYARWADVARYSYTYNARHAYTQYVQEAWLALYGVWLNQVRLDYSYDATDTVLLQQAQLGWASNVQSWAGVYKTYYYNNSTSNKPDSALMKSYNSSGNEQNFRRIMFGYDAAGLRSSETAEVWYSNNTYGNLYQILLTYNSYGQQTVQDVKYWRNNAWSYADANAMRNNTYYESFTTAVGAVNKNAITDLSLSPVPASDVLDIQIKWAEPQDFNVVITDMSGRVASQFSQSAQQQFKTAISVAALPAGNYLLSVKGAKGGSAARMITVRR